MLHGPHGTGAVQRVLYAVYLLALLAFTYGFTVARALFITSDPGWLHDRLLGPGAAVVAVVLAVALTVLVTAWGAAAARRAPAAVGRPRRRRPARPGDHPARVVARLGHAAPGRRDGLRRGPRRWPVGVGHDRAGSLVVALLVGPALGAASPRPGSPARSERASSGADALPSTDERRPAGSAGSARPPRCAASGSPPCAPRASAPRGWAARCSRVTCGRPGSRPPRRCTAGAGCGCARTVGSSPSSPATCWACAGSPA